MACILIVDDRPINREFLRALLGYAGHEVLEANDGSEALEVCKRARIDLVISDVLMPVMDGVELAQRLRTEPNVPTVPIMFYTATYRLNEARELADSCGVRTIVPKPSDPQFILDAVHSELALPQQAFELERLPATTATAFGTAADRLCVSSTMELTGLKRRLQDAVAIDESPSGKARRLEGLSVHIDESLTRAQALSIRLAALVELGLDLAGEREPEKMVALFCRAARDILSARIATICTIVEDGGRPQHLSTWGLTKAQAARLHFEIDPVAGLLGEAMRDGEPRLAGNIGGKHQALGLPESHPPVSSLMVTPIKTDSRTYGWFYVADHIGNDEFDQDDEQIAAMLASTLAPHYENLVLYDRLRRNVGVLEIETDQRKAALEQLEKSEARFRQLAENIRDVFFLSDALTGEYLYISPIYEEIWERSVESLYEDSDSWLDTVHPADLDRVQTLTETSSSSDRSTYEFRLLRSNGQTRWIRWRSFPIVDDGGKAYRIASLAEDVTEIKIQSLRIQRLSRIRAVLSDINSAIVRIQEKELLIEEACRIAVDEGGFPVAWIGLTATDNRRALTASHAGDNPDLAARFDLLLRNATAVQRGTIGQVLRTKQTMIVDPTMNTAPDCAVLQETRSQGYGALCGIPLLLAGELIGVIVLCATEKDFFDADELSLLHELAGDVALALRQIDQAEQLNYLAYYDPLTGLANSALFQERLAQLIDDHPDTQTAVFLVDLDRFTELNNSLGRHVGDDILCRIARRLQRTLPESRALARVGNDSFGIAVSALRHETEARIVFQERILGALQRSFTIDDSEIRIALRGGIAVYPRDGRESHTLISKAETALKEAKTSGARYQFYSPDLRARVSEELVLEQRLLRAVEEQDFVLHYQPKVDAKTRAVIGFECLLRWQSKEDGLVRPDLFIPALERSELILDVGRWVIERALADLVQWRSQGLDSPPISVNVSPVQLRYPDFADMVIETVKRVGTSPADLELEITESVIMDDIELNQDRLQRLSDNGIKLTIDDFGTGYSSLRYLAKMPLDSLKIDRSFVSSMTSDSDNMTMVSTMITLAHAFNLTVIAEGVETEEQAKLLALMRCDAMQGFLFGKPLAAAAVAELIKRQ